MKRVGTFAAIAFGSAAVLAAQGAGQTSQPQPGRSGGSSDTRQTPSSQTGTVTLTGCLQRSGGASGGSSSGAGSSASGAAASGASASSASYILTDASMGSGSGSGSSASGSSGAGAAGTSGSSAAGAAGTSGSSAAGRSGSTYMLDGSASEFSSHVNKRVQVTGTMASGSASGSSSGAGTPGSGAGSSGAGASASGSSSSGQHFKVTSVREVGGDCSSSSSSPR
jgi:hypothetical protein